MAASHVAGHAKDGPPVVHLGGGFSRALVMPHDSRPLFLGAWRAHALHWSGSTWPAAEPARSAGTPWTATGWSRGRGTNRWRGVRGELREWGEG